MRTRVSRILGAVALVAVLLLSSAPAFAQGGTTNTISGVVVDSGGGVIPGADVVVKHNATNVTQSKVTNSEGVFTFSNLNIGTYTVTVSLSGFKTFVTNDVVLTSTAPASVKATLTVGGIEETVMVQSTAEIIQTQSTTISSTVNIKQITQLPLTTRSVMDFVTLLPGVSTPGGNRSSTVNGLPQGMINITLDGVNIQDNTLRSTDGFFSIVAPRLDAVEEVSVTTAGQGADSAQGAVQIKFVTRSGSNLFTGSLYEYRRQDSMIANTWFNIRDKVAKAKLKSDQYGGRVGGPIMIPGLFDGRNKAFFFFNMEKTTSPSDVTRNRTLLNTQAQQGIYAFAGGQLDVLALAAANGQVSTVDPIIKQLLIDIRSSTAGGSLTDLDTNTQRFTYNVPVVSNRMYPTVRVDYNITNRHRFTSSFNYQKFTDYPDTLNSRDANWPGFPVSAGQTSIRLSLSNSIQSTLRNNLMNEVRVGLSSAPVKFFDELTTSMWKGTTIANQNGFQLNLGTVGQGLTGPSAAPSPQSRNAKQLAIEDTVTWLKGSHSITGGLSFTQYTYWQKMSALVPSMNFGLVTGDPAENMITSAMVGGSSTNQTAANQLYSLLTGRVSAITGDARINEATDKYDYMGVGTERARMNEMGFYVQDAWRVKPNLTANLGVRYDLQFPFFPMNNAYSIATMADFCGISGMDSSGNCNLFNPNVQSGKVPQFYQYTAGTKGYQTQYKNISPSLGVAWTIGGGSGLLKALFGNEGDSVIRVGASRAYSRSGMNDFTGRFAGNPGLTIPASRSQSLGNLGTLPLLFRDPSGLGAPAVLAAPVYPMTTDVTGQIRVFDQNIKVPYADSYSFGISRAITKTMAVEVRYVGTRSRLGWANLSYNEVDIFENGFLNEFRLAQANLQANIAAGRGANFKYFGAGTGTSPLPIMLAYFAGVSQANASNAALYTSTNFSSSTYVNPLATYNPNPFTVAQALVLNSTTRANGVTAGLPRNFFVMNPDLLGTSSTTVGGSSFTTNQVSTDFNGLQVELRRRYSGGLQFAASYAFGRGWTSNFRTLRQPVFMVRRVGATGDVDHSFKLNAVYDMPFGQGRRFLGNAGGLLERIVGGWSVGLTSRVQSGYLVDLGNVRLMGGLTADEVQSLFKIRIDPTTQKVYMLPQDIIDQTVKAFSVSATTATGYGTLGAPSGKYFAPANGPDCIEIDNGAGYGGCPGTTRSLALRGPWFSQSDLSVAKRIRVVGRVNVELRAEILNLFNKVNYVPTNYLGNQAASFEVTSLTGTNTSRTAQFVGRFSW
ncbi:MAG: TonB-dependent receptor [Acidobacteria bacterium]|nr:TonB-dependent receptor [Acidobacteriota bacterium]